MTRPDAAAKLSGTFRYAGDLHHDGELHGVTVRSPIAAGRLNGIDVEAALALPGACLVLTARDVPGSARIGLKVDDQPVLAVDQVRYVGEPIAFAVADTAETARLMATLVRPRLVPTPPLLDPARALDPDAPPVGPDGNLVSAAQLSRGSGRRGPVVVRGVWSTGRQDAAFLAPEAGLAAPLPDGGVVLDVATQDVHEDRRQIALALGLPVEQVLVRLAGVGGAFGGREDITLHVHLSLAALRSGRPVRAVYSRAESFLAHPSRHPSTMRYELTADDDGRFVSLDADILLDGGAYASTSLPITKIVHYFAAGAYRFDSVAIRTRAVYTNNPVAGALRGFGATQACFGIESTVDRMAAELGMDPLELRRRNLLEPGEALATSGQPLLGSHASAGPAGVLAACAAAPLPDAETIAGPLIRRGVGYAVGIKSAGLGDGRSDPAGLRLTLDRTGITVFSAAPEVGQGIVSVLTRIVADGVPGVPITLARSTSGLPVSGGSKASRQTMASGGAADRAVRALRAELDALAAELGRPDWTAMPPAELLDELLGERSLSVEAVNPGLPTETADRVTGAGRLHQSFQLTAHRAVVDVDVELGTARLVQLIAAQDVGTAIDRLAVTGQLIGGSVQGAGFALLEEIGVNELGLPQADGFGQYLIPVADDVPQVRAVILEHPDDRLALGAKGLGEGPLVSSPAAVAAALRAATGRAVPRIPARALDLVAAPDLVTALDLVGGDA